MLVLKKKTHIYTIKCCFIAFVWHAEHLYQTLICCCYEVFYIQLSMIKILHDYIYTRTYISLKNTHLLKISLLFLFGKTMFAGSYDIFYVAYVIHENLQSQCSQTIYHALFHLDSYKNWNTTNLTRISVERKMCHASEKIMRCDLHISKGRTKNTKKVS